MTQGYLATGQTQKKIKHCEIIGWLRGKKKQSGRKKSKYTEVTFLFHDNLTFLYISCGRFKCACWNMWHIDIKIVLFMSLNACKSFIPWYKHVRLYLYYSPFCLPHASLLLKGNIVFSAVHIHWCMFSYAGNCSFFVRHTSCLKPLRIEKLSKDACWSLLLFLNKLIDIIYLWIM